MFIARPIAAQSKAHTITRAYVLVKCVTQTARVRVFITRRILRPETTKLAARPRGRTDVTMHLHRPHSASAAHAAGTRSVSRIT